MSRTVRRTLIGSAIACIAALIAVAFILLPPEMTVGAGRLGDYVIHSSALLKVDNDPTLRSVLTALHLKTVDIATLSDQIALVAIDEESLDPKAGLGQFPFPRSVYATLIDRLSKAGAKAIAFDMIFTEPSRSPGEDEKFGAAMRRSGRVVLPLILNKNSRAAEFPVFPLADSAKRLAFTSTETLGGILVAQPPVIIASAGESKQIPFANLGGALASVGTGKDLRLLADGTTVMWGDRRVPVDAQSMPLLPISVEEFDDPDIRGGAAMLIPSFGQALSIAKIVKPSGISDADLKKFAGGALVIVGSTAQAVGDYIDTPTGRVPGVFANEMFAAQFLSNTFVQPAGKWWDAAVTLLLALLCGIALMRFHLGRAALAIALLGVVYGVVNLLLFTTSLVWLNVIHVEGGMILATLGVAIYRFAMENREKKQLHTMFAGYLDPTLVDSMMKLDDPTQALKLSGKRAKVTIFYSDIRSFTAISETMPAEAIYAQLNEYFEEMCEICFRYGGYPDKFIGDCLMAVFSAPIPREDDAVRAVKMALEQQAKIAEMAQAWKARGMTPFTVGMGLNTGEVVLGNLGSSKKMSYTVIGDNVNTAARLYNVALGGQIIVSESTYEEVKAEVIVNELQPIMVKGKSLPLRNFEVVGLRADMPGVASQMWTGSSEAVWSGKH